MKDKEEDKQLFRFKQFSLYHDSSSMKIGVDGVLIGAWGNVKGCRGLDIGCGCGLIGLMAAQRNRKCIIDMIDIHAGSVSEARLNSTRSKWSERTNVYQIDILQFVSDKNNFENYDFIISNPPFYHSGILSPDTPREKARHEGSLSPSTLIEYSRRLLKHGGKLSMITTADFLDKVHQDDIFKVTKFCYVADKPGKDPKRVMITMEKRLYDTQAPKPVGDMLYLRDVSGEYSEKYRALTREFYLKF